jgi:heme exporter protein C
LNTSLRNNRAVLLAAAAALLLLVGTALAFYWVPSAPIEGFRQRIFYFHVPIAITAYACFGWAAWKALRLLWTREQRYDLESYTAVHMGVIFGILTLLTGSIWARTSWGHWWVWGSRQLVLFLVLFLFYAAYFMLGGRTCRPSTRSSAWR